MKRLIKNEKGYTLILTVGIIVIFTVLGLSLLTLTSSGIKKNENRQNTVQAQDLSDKGIKYAVNDLQHYLENEIKNNPMGKTQFNELLENTIKETCPKSNGIEIPSEKENKTQVCIERVEMISNEEKDRYKRLVTFKSTGIVNGKTHTTTSKVIIGTDSIPDQLRYALSTNDGGDLYLHGGVEIQGDIKTDGNLIITKHAFWRDIENPEWEKSVGPRLIKDTKSITPKIIMKDKDEYNKYKYIYLVDDKSYPKNDDFFTNKNNFLDKYAKISPAEANAMNTVKANLFNTPNLNIVTRSLPADNIDVLSKIEEKNNETVDYRFSDLNISNGKFDKSGNYNFNKNTTIVVGGKYQRCAKYSWFECSEYEDYYDGDMNIYDNKDISLKGSYYINGDLTINNTNLKSDALMYVNGDVTIRYSTLKGIDSDPNSTLIIFAKGNIKIANISEDSKYDKPSKIKGFFYSQSNMIMYGVGSNIRLTGGISSKRLILTALRGDVSKNTEPISNQSLLKENGQPMYPSRLTITYDENLIQQFTSFTRDQKEEYITQLNDPEYIERSN